MGATASDQTGTESRKSVTIVCDSVLEAPDDKLFAIQEEFCVKEVLYH